MRRYSCPVLCFLLAVIPANVQAQVHKHTGNTSPYAGFETRSIKSLSEADIEELRSGGGWGLALAAELNGVPGPAHLLELKDELDLSVDQVAEIKAIYNQMRAEATAAGERFIAAETAIEHAFASGQIDATRLQSLIDESEGVRAELRFIHLSRHLLTTPILTLEQIERYNIVRGYTSDPCAHVPEGHNPDMWRRHNGCD